MFAWRRTAVRKRVVVNLADKAFTGILWKQAGPLLVLRDARLLHPGAPEVPVDGEVVIERTKVEFTQVLGGGEG
ncbi:hypothetical protein [Streptomyces sp. NPDC056987]|uniref:hypothetical protein n=1 Tax=Streptomyces sp. NPDC056987 TaxID=3345988 RepID=UPI003633BEAA